MNFPFDIVMVPLQIIIFLFTVYFFFIGFFGLWRFKEKKITTPEKTMAVIVAAHNEQAVIGQLVENLKQLEYPKELYDIYVGIHLKSKKFIDNLNSWGHIMSKEDNAD